MTDIPTDYAAEFALAPVHEAGTTTIVEYEAVERAYGAELDASAVGEGGAGLVLSSDDRSARYAYYFDEGLGRYGRWLSCTGCVEAPDALAAGRAGAGGADAGGLPGG